jgi:hypothetical protein
MCSIGASGSPHAAFQRALRNRNLTRALTEARELPVVSLADALDLVLLLSEQRPDRYGRAAARWLGRYILEERHVDLVEAQLVAAALAGLRGYDPRPAALTLRSLARRRRMTDTETVLTRWALGGTFHRMTK